MSADPAFTSGARNPEPIIRELHPLRVGPDQIGVRVIASRQEDGSWRGRLVFGAGDLDKCPSTAEILYGGSERDLWQSVLDLRDHHLKDLYRAVSE